ncbi:MAG TPA: NAD-dependent epimerase/dehydratase family protein [Vicinamibacterales bacterium]|nr:NAD-dependent epimerase/dehydratase family protein [Vicinamibacterales bacterium]
MATKGIGVIRRHAVLMKRVLVTGASGFIGRALVDELSNQRFDVRAMVHRQLAAGFAPEVDVVRADVRDSAAMDLVTRERDTVVHLAARVHDRAAGDADFEDVNVRGTVNLLEAALRNGVERLVMLSSVAVFGPTISSCIDESQAPRPASAYARSKLAAEDLLMRAAASGDLHAAAVRAPTVYGPGHKGKIHQMMTTIDRGLFPPVADTHNRRSLAHVDNVVSAVLLAAQHPRANGARYVVTDAAPYSTRYLYETLCRGLGRRVPSWRLPLWPARVAGYGGDLVGRISGRRAPFDSADVESLFGSAWYSSTRITRELGYSPVISFETGLAALIAWFRAQRR